MIIYHEEEEEKGKRDFPIQYTKVKEEDGQIDEKNSLEWMDTDIKTK